jgi:uncharacterized sodium:solute symporter family permease YidK
VAFGMIGTALWGDFYFGSWRSGAASGEQFKYFQFVLGNAIGFIFIAKVLLPLYYRMNLTSIYGYIERRLGTYSYKTAATIFLISRTIGSAFRLYLVVIVLQRFVFDFTESLCSYRIDFISFNICLHLSRRLKTIIMMILYKHFLSHFCLYDYLFYLPKLKSQYYRSL